MRRTQFFARCTCNSAMSYPRDFLCSMQPVPAAPMSDPTAGSMPHGTCVPAVKFYLLHILYPICVICCNDFWQRPITAVAAVAGAFPHGGSAVTAQDPAVAFTTVCGYRHGARLIGSAARPASHLPARVRSPFDVWDTGKCNATVLRGSLAALVPAPAAPRARGRGKSCRRGRRIRRPLASRRSRLQSACGAGDLRLRRQRPRPPRGLRHPCYSRARVELA